jgi:putative transposase
MYGPLRKELGAVFHELARPKECQVVEGHLLLDHVHLLISIPPKYAVSRVVGFIKGKSAIHVARTFGRKKNFTGPSFGARGYYVSTTGKDEEEVRRYILKQEEEDRRLDQLNLFDE